MLDEEHNKSKSYRQQLENMEGGEEYQSKVENLQNLVTNMTLTIEEKDMEISALKSINKHL